LVVGHWWSFIASGWIKLKTATATENLPLDARSWMLDSGFLIVANWLLGIPPAPKLPSLIWILEFVLWNFMSWSLVIGGHLSLVVAQTENWDCD
jgi:hypothetical protein